MKRIVFSMLAISICTGLFAQVLTSPREDDDDFRTIFDGENIRVGAFGGPMMTFTVIDGQFSHMMGGGGGIIVGGFYFGGYGMGLTNNIGANAPYEPDEFIEFGHGGFMTGFTMFGNKAIHPTFNALIGWGNVSVREEHGWSLDDEKDGVFVFEPSIQLEMNFSRFFRVAVGGGYRLVSSLDNLAGYDNMDFSGPSASLTFKFGWF